MLHMSSGTLCACRELGSYRVSARELLVISTCTHGFFLRVSKDRGGGGAGRENFPAQSGLAAQSALVRRSDLELRAQCPLLPHHSFAAPRGDTRAVPSHIRQLWTWHPIMFTRHRPRDYSRSSRLCTFGKDDLWTYDSSHRSVTAVKKSPTSILPGCENPSTVGSSRCPRSERCLRLPGLLASGWDLFLYQRYDDDKKGPVRICSPSTVVRLLPVGLKAGVEHRVLDVSRRGP